MHETFLCFRILMIKKSQKFSFVFSIFFKFILNLLKLKDFKKILKKIIFEPLTLRLTTLIALHYALLDFRTHNNPKCLKFGCIYSIM